MTDRVKGIVVALEEDIRVDDVQVIVDAIKAIRGVANAEVNLVDIEDWINRQQIKTQIKADLLDLWKKI